MFVCSAWLHCAELSTRCAAYAVRCAGLQVEKKRGDARREAEAVRGEQRGREAAQRRLNRAELDSKQLAEQLPGLQITVGNMGAQLVAEQRQAGKATAVSRKLAAEVAAMVEEVAAGKQLVSASGRGRGKGQMGGCKGPLLA